MAIVALRQPDELSIQSPIHISSEMMRAGRRAFMRRRRELDDLYHFFDCDRDRFIASIYRAMAAKADG